MIKTSDNCVFSKADLRAITLKYDNWLSLQNELIFLAFVIKRQFQTVEAYLFSDVVEEINFFAPICTEFWSKILIYSMVNSWYHNLYSLFFNSQHYFFFSFSSTVEVVALYTFQGHQGRFLAGKYRQDSRLVAALLFFKSMTPSCFLIWFDVVKFLAQYLQEYSFSPTWNI